MAVEYAMHFNPNVTPQQERARADQVENSAGGFVWQIDDWARLDRFLILGVEGGTFYASERKLARESGELIVRLLQQDAHRVVDRIVEVSVQGRAHKNDHALFALALAFTVPNNLHLELALSDVARTGTHLFTFVEYVNSLRGWGRKLRRAVAFWYERRDPTKLAYQVSKYQQRNGWSHRDLLRLSHPKTDDAERNAIFSWACGKQHESTPEYLQAVGDVLAGGDYPIKNLCAAIRTYNLPREVVPTSALTKPEVWEALLERMPLTAMIRNLATMTRVGLLQQMSDAERQVIAKLGDRDALRKARIHPISVLAAHYTYASGRGVRGDNTWIPLPRVIDALNDAFYATFDNVQPTGKRTLLALDVSGSMAMGAVSGVVGLTPRAASAALALVTASTEQEWALMGFSSTFCPLNISPRQRLSDAIHAVSTLPFSATDCALPMLWALQNKIEVDTFVIYTDSETWYGGIHPFQALRQYRQMVPKAKLVVVGMTGSAFSIADPNDPGMLDVVGFSTDTPNAIAEFSRG